VSRLDIKPDPRLDLLLERVVDVPPELVWAAWTVPEHVKKWFTPAPWTRVDCEIDLRPGGIFASSCVRPKDRTFPNIGCYHQSSNRRLVWTVALAPGYRPASERPDARSPFTAIIALEPRGTGQMRAQNEEAARDTRRWAS
jgi:uncharacterized protein YndB with AHSA1/START domain